jgi:uncharacterized membrane protein YbhN (UPF0104 family)
VFRNKAAYLAISAVLSVTLLLFLLSRISGKDLIDTFRRIYWPALLAYAGISLASAWLRAWRYRWLLSPLPISWGNIFLVTFIRNSFDDLLPARIGSLSYIYFLNKRLNFPFEAAASSFVVALILDFLTLSPFLVLALLVVGVAEASLPGPILLSFAVVYFIATAVVFWNIVPVSRFLLLLYQRILKVLGVGEKKKALLSVEKFKMTIDSLTQVEKRRIGVPLLVLSLFIRLGKYLSLYALLFGLLRSQGFGLSGIGFWKAILGITGAELTSILPIRGLAGFGTWESAWALSLRLMGFDPKLAIVSGIGIHLITNLFEYGLGLASLLVLAMPYFRRRPGCPRAGFMQE